VFDEGSLLTRVTFRSPSAHDRVFSSAAASAILRASGQIDPGLRPEQLLTLDLLPRT